MADPTSGETAEKKSYPSAPAYPVSKKASDGPKAPDMVLIRNVSGRMLTVNLAGKHLSSGSGSAHAYKHVKLVTVKHTKNGVLSMLSRKTLMPTAIRLLANQDTVVERCALACPDMIKALAKKQVRVIKDPADPTPSKASK